MSRKSTIIVAAILVAAAIGIYAWREFNRTNEDLTGINPAYTVNAQTLIGEFGSNDSAANARYLGRVVQVEGMVKQVEKDEEGKYTVVLGDTADMSSVRCAMDSVHAGSASSLQRGQSVKVKGAFTGFKKDETGLLGSDVEMNRAVVVKK
jgi:hypothetical protein